MIPEIYKRVWCVDFEYSHNPGGFLEPLCMVAREIYSGELVRVWLGSSPPECPIPFGKSDLLVAYLASAEIGCFLALGWSLPENVLDLYAEFSNKICGEPLPFGRGLIGALSYFGLPNIDQKYKKSMRDLALRGGEYTAAEQLALLDYCQSDVDGLALLLKVMVPKIDWPRAIGIRGRYMRAVARMEHTGIPIDTSTLAKLMANWESIKTKLVQMTDPTSEAFLIQNGKPVFKRDRFTQLLIKLDIPWPRNERGGLILDKDTFSDMAKVHGGKIALIHELRKTLSGLRSNSLEVGSDGRNRCMLSPFGSKTSRNQPSNSKFIFGFPAWLRGLIQPHPGCAVAYVDWSQQEFAIAAYISSDQKMLEAYSSGDPYLAFAIQAGAAPPDATKASHAEVRSQYKMCVLGTQYGLGAVGLGARLGLGACWGEHLLKMHRKTYPQFWAWSDQVEACGLLRGELQAPFGWRCSFRTKPNPRSIRNWPMQTAGAEMMRLAAIYATEAGLNVCAPVHDAFLIEACATEIDSAVARMQECMRKAGEATLPGFTLRSDAEITVYPDRFGGGSAMWDRVMGLLEKCTDTPEMQAVSS
jgi:DNA polymerase-1